MSERDETASENVWMWKQKWTLIRTFNVFTILVQFWWSCVKCNLSFLFLADSRETQCGFYQLQTSPWWRSFLKFFYKLQVVTRVTSSSCCLSVHPVCAISRPLCVTENWSWQEIFSVSRHSLEIPVMVVSENPSGSSDQQQWRLKITEFSL